MKKLVFVYSRKNLGKILNITRQKGCELVSLSPEMDYLLQEQKINFKGIRDYEIRPVAYRKLYLARRRLHNRWGRIKVNGKIIREKLSIHGVSVWDLLENELGELNLEIIMYYTDIIKQIFDIERPDEIYCNENIDFYLVHRDKDIIPALIRTISGGKYRPIGRNMGKDLMQSILNIAIDLLHDLKKYHRGKIRRFTSPASRRRVLFFLPSLGLDKTAAIQRELQKKHFALSICTGGLRDADFQRSLDNNKLMYAYIESFMDGRIRKEVKKFASKCRRIWEMARKKPFMYNGVNLSDTFEHQLRYAFLRRAPELHGHVLLLGRIYCQLKPSLVVTTNESTSFGKASVLLANECSIETLLIQHAKLPDISCLTMPISNRITVWNKVKENMLETGIDKKRFIVTGNSKHEFITTMYTKTEAQSVRKELKISSNKKIIVFAARFSVTRDFFRIRDFQDIVESENAIGIVKLHPAETRISLHRLRQIFPSNSLIFLKSYDFVKLLKVSDLVISTEECTTTMDALMVEKPIVTLNYEESFDQPLTESIDYTSKRPFYHAKSKNEFSRYVRLILHEKKQKLIARMKEFNQQYHRNEKSDYKILQLIKSLI